MNTTKNILVTGGAGFIGSHVARHFVKTYPQYHIVVLDKLTYAGNMENLADFSDAPNFDFVQGDIVNSSDVKSALERFKITDIIHLAAESHVDRSIEGPLEFVQTNVLGTVNLMQCAIEYWGTLAGHVFHHVSTDEVYGSLGEEGLFEETTPYDPRSPYSASKAASDHFVRAFYHTYGLEVKLSNCSNNYGSHHFPEKLIPLVILNILNKKPLPIYGNGLNVRDWLYVEDHARAIDIIFHNGKIGESYNVGGLNEWTNIDLVRKICSIMDRKLSQPEGTASELITFVKDRAGHDMRYAIDSTKLTEELGWKPSLQFEEGIERTIDWYLANPKWIENILNGAYMDYYQNMYSKK